MSIMELTKYQFDTLNMAANGPTKVFVVMYDSPKDSEEKAKRLRQDMREIGELEGLGYVTDVSKEFQESISQSRINNNREFGVFAITEVGYKMFEGFEGRTVN
jgi:hypothetical protein